MALPDGVERRENRDTREAPEAGFVCASTRHALAGPLSCVAVKRTGEIRFVQEAVMEFGPPKMRLSLATRIRRWWARRCLY